MQSRILTLEEEEKDVDRADLRAFIRDGCGMANTDKDCVDAVADIVQSSAIDLAACSSASLPPR
jgi:hypothetical protein